MSDIYFEEGLEKVFIDFIESLGYTYVPHQTIVRDSMKSPIASEVFEESLLRINPDLPEEVIEQAIYQVKNIVPILSTQQMVASDFRRRDRFYPDRPLAREWR
jgi:hypothetical protein